jgi:hypothetical protein
VVFESRSTVADLTTFLAEGGLLVDYSGGTGILLDRLKLRLCGSRVGARRSFCGSRWRSFGATLLWRSAIFVSFNDRGDWNAWMRYSGPPSATGE